MTSTATFIASLDEISKPSSCFTLIFTNRYKSSIPELSSFKNLVSPIQIELDLSGNFFTSFVPELSQLRYLKKLNLSRNGIEELWELPSSVEQLSLAENLLRTANGLQRLPRLQSLDLTGNQINGLQPLGELKQLKGLYLGGNRISTLTGLAQFPAILEIDLENNSICTEETWEIAENLTLCAVNLRKNPLLL
jgi:Leucine-rich repeat (LRR) protein